MNPTLEFLMKQHEHVMYLAYSLLLVLVSHFIVHTVRTRNTSRHGQTAQG